MLPNPWKYACMALGAALLALGLYTLFLHAAKALAVSRMDQAIASLASFKEQVRAEGEKAKADKIKTETENAEKLAKEKKRGDASRAELAEWVRKYGADSRGLPDNSKSAAEASGTGKVCYEYATVDRALRAYRQAVSGLIAEGAEAIVSLQECVGAWPTSH